MVVAVRDVGKRKMTLHGPTGDRRLQDRLPIGVTNAGLGQRTRNALAAKREPGIQLSRPQA
jgi:hypothetical protein